MQGVPEHNFRASGTSVRVGIAAVTYHKTPAISLITRQCEAAVVM
jgi:hypothetical protein